MNKLDVVAGKYRVIRELGRGGMGVVYEAEHTNTSRRVALKVLVGGADEELVLRFAREARAAGAIESPYIVTVFDSGVDQETHTPYLAMELLRGRDLTAFMRKQRTLPVALALRIVAQACTGLVSAHSAGVVHRDIKLGNLFLAEITETAIAVKLLDFGVAKLTLDRIKEGEHGDLTQTGSTVGSPRYMSPEQARGMKDIDQRADVYSLGVVLHKLLSGNTPFNDVESLGELIFAQMSRHVPDVRTIAPWVDARTAEVVARSLARDRNDRYASSREMLDVILAITGPDITLSSSAMKTMLEAHKASAAAKHVPRESDPSAGARANANSAAAGVREATLPWAQVPSSSSNMVASGPTLPEHPISSPTNTPVSHSSPPIRAIELRGGAQSRRLWPYMTIAAGVFVMSGVVGFIINQTSLLRRPSNVAANPGNATSSTTTITPSAIDSSTNVVPPATSVASARVVKLTVAPADAVVYVDDVQVEVVGGMIDLNGALGATRSVRVVAGKQEVRQTVAITEDGPLPARVAVDRATTTRAAAAHAPQGGSPRSTSGGPTAGTTKPAPAGSFSLQKSFE